MVVYSLWPYRLWQVEELHSLYLLWQVAELHSLYSLWPYLLWQVAELHSLYLLWPYLLWQVAEGEPRLLSAFKELVKNDYPLAEALYAGGVFAVSQSVGN